MVSRPTLSFAVQFTLTPTRKWKSSEKGYQPTASTYYCQHKPQSKNGVGLATKLYIIVQPRTWVHLCKHHNIQMVINMLVPIIRLGVGLWQDTAFHDKLPGLPSCGTVWSVRLIQYIQPVLTRHFTLEGISHALCCCQLIVSHPDPRLGTRLAHHFISLGTRLSARRARRVWYRDYYFMAL